MGYIAFFGNKERASEIQDIFKMLGGKELYDVKTNQGLIDYSNDKLCYFIDNQGFVKVDNFIDCLFVMELDDFKRRYHYKVGDVVTISESRTGTLTNMYWSYTDCEVFYNFVGHDNKTYINNLKVDNIVCGLKPDNGNKENNKLETEKIDTPMLGCVITKNGDYEVILNDNFEVSVENGKILLKRKKPNLPKTFEECCNVLHIVYTYEPIPQGIHRYDVLNTLRKLFICRDAYWKICNDYNPDWTDDMTDKSVISCQSGKIVKDTLSYYSRFLSFPNDEVRDIFLENFKDMIEIVKYYI